MRETWEMRDTADIREKMIKLWKQLDENKITATQVRLHIGIARTILETLKVEMAAAHLNKTHIDAVQVIEMPIRLSKQ
jgi:hypothetical protein